MPRKANVFNPRPMVLTSTVDNAPLSQVKESSWRSRALTAAAELATICKAKSRRRGSKRWVIYRLDVCPITGEFYPDPDPFVEAPQIAASPDGAVIFTMPDRQGDQMAELLTKLRAAGHELPRMADYEDPWDERAILQQLGI